MSDDLEQRLAQAAAALRERELTEQRCEDLRVRIEQMRMELAELRSRYAAEQRDVDKLEGLTLSRVLASLRGAHDDLLARERAEADAARYRLAEAEARLDALRTELADVPGLTLAAPQMAIGGMTKFADIWFDNIFTDFVVAKRIDEARWNVDRAVRLVDVLVGRLAQRAAPTRADLDRIEAERNTLLTAG